MRCGDIYHPNWGCHDEHAGKTGSAGRRSRHPGSCQRKSDVRQWGLQLADAPDDLPSACDIRLGVGRGVEWGIYQLQGLHLSSWAYPDILFQHRVRLEASLYSWSLRPSPQLSHRFGANFSLASSPRRGRGKCIRLDTRRWPLFPA